MHNKWNQFYKNNGRFYLLPHEEFEKATNIFKERGIKKVIDLGCGSGRHLVKLAELGFDVTGLDYSPQAAEMAEEWLKEKKLEGKVFTGDYRHDLHNFPRESFDGIVSINALHHADEESDYDQVFNQINKVLHPEGMIFFVIPSKNSPVIEPNTINLFLEEKDLQALLGGYFHVFEMYKDKNEAWVIFGEKKYIGDAKK